MSRSQVRKGANFERTVANLFRAAGIEIERNGHKQRSAKGSEACADLESAFFAIECSKGKSVPIRPKLRQAQAGAKGHQYAVAVIGDDGQPPLVALTLEDFLALAGEWERMRKE